MNELRPPVTASRLRQGWFELMLDETRFLQRYPHYAGVLARMDSITANTVKVMAVCLRRWDDPDRGSSCWSIAITSSVTRNSGWACCSMRSSTFCSGI